MSKHELVHVFLAMTPLPVTAEDPFGREAWAGVIASRIS
jgi:hypothetical protein